MKAPPPKPTSEEEVAVWRADALGRLKELHRYFSQVVLLRIVKLRLSGSDLPNLQGALRLYFSAIDRIRNTRDVATWEGWREVRTLDLLKANLPEGPKEHTEQLTRLLEETMRFVQQSRGS